MNEIKVGDVVVVKVGGSYSEMKVSQLCGDSAVLKETKHGAAYRGRHLIVPCETLLLRKFPLGVTPKVVMVGGKREAETSVESTIATALRRLSDGQPI